MTYLPTVNWLEPLWCLLESFGLERSILGPECEGRDAISLPVIPVRRSHLSEARTYAIEDCCRLFGSSLSLELRHGESNIVPIVQGEVASGIGQLLANTEGVDRYTMHLRVAKSQLTENHWPLSDEYHVTFVFFVEYLAEILKETITQIEERFFPSDRVKKSIIIVSGANVLADGPYIAIVGGTYIHEIGTLSAPNDSLNQRIEYIYATARENLIWQESWVKRITPLHLAVNSRSQSHEEVENLGLQKQVFASLAGHLTNLTLLFTARRSDSNGRHWLFHYTSANRLVTVRSSSVSVEEWDTFSDQIDSLAKVIEWLYEEYAQESRIALVQEVVVRETLGLKGLVLGSDLARRSEAVVSQLEWSWQTFISEKLDDHLDLVRALEREVEDTIRGVSSQISSLVKGLTDSTVGAVAAIIGSVIAALLPEGFSPWVFATGLITYALYVGIFLLGFSVPELTQRSQEIIEEFGKRRSTFDRYLGQQRVDTLVDTRIEKSEQRWKAWRRKTITAYILLATVLVLASLTAILTDGDAGDPNSNSQQPPAITSPVATPLGEQLGKSNRVQSNTCLDAGRIVQPLNSLTTTASNALAAWSNYGHE